MVFVVSYMKPWFLFLVWEWLYRYYKTLPYHGERFEIKIYPTQPTLNSPSFNFNLRTCIVHQCNPANFQFMNNKLSVT